MDTARTLTENLAALLRREHDALADFLVALADFDRRGCWRALGHTSLFWFLHRELGLSKGAAFYRKTAAELVQRFPEVIDPLRDGRLCLTSIAALAKVITLENRHEVLPRFFHRSKSEALEVVAELKPVETPPRREVVTAVRLSSPANVSTNASAPASVAPSPEVARTAELALTPGGFPENLLDANSTRAVAQAPTSRDERIDRDVRIEPLTADLRRLPSRSLAGCWRSSTPPATRSRTPFRTRAPPRSSTPPSTCSSRRPPDKRASSRSRRRLLGPRSTTATSPRT